MEGRYLCVQEHRLGHRATHLNDVHRLQTMKRRVQTIFALDRPIISLARDFATWSSLENPGRFRAEVLYKTTKYVALIYLHK